MNQEQLTYLAKLKTSIRYDEFQKSMIKITDWMKRTKGQISEKEIQKDTMNGISKHAKTLARLAESHTNILDMLYLMQDSADVIYSHMVNVGLLCAVLGGWLKYQPEEIEMLALSGLLHDIGKVLIPEEILLKPDKLSEEEFEMVKAHPVMGYRIVSDMNIDIGVKKCILMHHERCNGTGYPVGAERKGIHKYAKIAAIADVYDAMTARRSHRAALSPFKVIAEFESDGLQLYETAFIMTFLKNIADTYLHSNVMLSNGQTATIIMINNNNLSRPVVKTEDDFIDLAKNKTIFIEAIV